MSTRTRFPLLTFVLLLILFLGGLFFVKPLWDDVNSLKIGKAEKLTQKNELAQKVENLQKIQKNLENASEVGKLTASNAIPERFEEDLLIQDITTIAQKNDVALNGINFSLSSGSQDKVKRATINVNLTAVESQLFSFLKGLETNQRKLIVKSLTVQSSKSDTSLARANFSISMETYYQDRL